MNAQMVLAGFQILNTIIRMFDPHGRDGNVRMILARHMSGELDEGDAVAKVMDHMRAKGQQTMAGWDQTKNV